MRGLGQGLFRAVSGTIPPSSCTGGGRRAVDKRSSEEREKHVEGAEASRSLVGEKGEIPVARRVGGRVENRWMSCIICPALSCIIY